MANDMREWRCRQCRTQLSGMAHVRLGAYMSGGTGLCVACVDALFSKYNVSTLHDLIPAYRRSQHVENETAALRREVGELRLLLEQVTDPQR
jgi:hypothetical protein